MKWAKSLRRWTMRSIHAAILGSALLGSASMVIAQAPSASASKVSDLHHTRSQSFDLPVQMRPEDRAGLSEIRLYIKTPTTAWKLQERGNADLTRFSCKVTQDGEYWYTLALVDRAGRMTPADVNLEPPSQRVMVDTTLPMIAVQATNANGELCLRCTVQDANPDYASLKAVCKTSAGDIPLDIVPNQPGLFRVRGTEMMQFPVVVSVKDLAGNLGAKEVNIREMLSATLNTAALKEQAVITPASVGPDNRFVAQSRPELPAPRDLPMPPPPRTDLPMVAKNEGPISTGQPTKVEFPPAPAPIATPPTPPAPIFTPPNPPTPLVTQPTPLPVNNPETIQNVSNKVAPVETPTQQSGPHQLINTTHATVEYRIDQVGPSGVGKVEIYMTPDKGQTWHRLAEDVQKRSPANINLPGDGVFGIRIVVTNGNGFGGKAPARGDAPHCTIEVDTTSPFVQLRSTDVLPSSGHVEIRWNATDKNLGSEPVSLFYRTRPDGPWQVIAKGVKNDGVHRWNFPRDAGGQFFFKIEVTDQAGNMAQHVSPQPVSIDMTEPRATVVGVTGSAAVRPSVGGN
jgi:hypothetical protein